MPARPIHSCECRSCQSPEDSPEKRHHGQLNLLMSRLDEQQRRWLAALESDRLGAGGDPVLSQVTGLDEKTIHRGREELVHSLEGRPPDRVRLPGGGRPPTEVKTPR
ncbi:MAG TPA: hypothetical protein VGN26_21790 [Armatimonadota bacterium]|jgi:hypothetical protein